MLRKAKSYSKTGEERAKQRKSARAWGFDGEPFLARCLRQAEIEANEWMLGRTLLGPDQGCRQLERIRCPE